ncbi:hypothetical protein D3C83_257880 [compost metagenome]
MLNALDHVNRVVGATVVLITHNAAIAAMADRVIRMRSGMIAEETRNPRRAAASEVQW